MYNSPYCKAETDKNKNAIICTWKQFCKGDDYKEPFLYAYKEVQKFKLSTWVTDTTNGFENKPSDTTWLLEEFMPLMVESSIRKVIFIISEDSPLKDEIEEQAVALKEFFEVELVENLENIL